LVLQVVNLTKRYGRLTALSDVSFAIRPGEILGVIGPNGSGKTTLFECLGGVLPADGGAMLREAHALTSAERTSTVFYLPDLIAPWPTETVRWALDFTVGYFRAWPRRDRLAPRAVATVDDVIARLELEPLLDSAIGTLSKGQRKRALLAIGLLTPQPILLADEPFDGLDLRQTREVGATLRHYAAAGRTMLLSIHQIGDAARVCDRFVLLSGGRTRGEGTLDELSALAAARDPHAAGRRGFDGSASGHHLEEIFLALT
jgi:ABC-type multidrug transport system ATPase subunit